MRLGLGLNITANSRRGGGTPAFSPSSLYSSGSQGIWLDPSDVANLDWRRNLLTYSERFDNAAWTKVNATPTADAATAPNGTTTADRITATDTSSRVEVPVTVATSTSYTYTVYAKSGTANWLSISLVFFTTPGNVSAWFDLSGAGAVGTVNSGITASIAAADNGFFRCSVTFTTDATDTAGTIRNNISASNGSAACSIGDSILLWGAQFELGSTATDYQRITDVNTEVIERFPTATMFSDRAGTTPVTAPGTVVGLRLDKSKGLVLGAEQKASGTVAIAGTATAATYNTTTGVGAVTRVDSSNQSFIQWSGLTSNSSYRVELSCQTGGIILRTGTQVGTIVLAVSAGQSATVVVPSDSSGRIAITNTTVASTSTFTVLSVRELPGNHAVAPTDAARPTYGVEPKGGRRNLLTFSEDFSNAIYTKNNLLAFGSGSTVNATVAPDGTTTADLITPATATALTGVDQYYNNTASAAHTLSVYVKANGANFVQLLWNVGLSSNFANFDLSAESVTAGTYTDATIVSQGNGWFRCSITSTLAVANQRAYISVIPATNSARAAAYTGNGTSGVYLWGAQLERDA